MPNNHGPSKGCRRCRVLKVKCNQDKPTCQRCHRGGHDCEYQNEFDRRHRDQNSKAQSNANEKWRQRAEIRVEAPMQELPNDSLAQRAYNRFWYDFIHPFPEGMGRLSGLFKTTTQDPCLLTVVTAVAYANYHGRLNSEEASEASRLHYGLALQQLAAMMADPDKMQRDDALTVILFLGLYEVFTSSVRDGSWITHMQGMQSVMAHTNNISLKDGSNYFPVLCFHLAIYYLAKRKIPPPQLDRLIQQIPFEYDFVKQLVALMSATASMCAKLGDFGGFEGLTGQTGVDIVHESLDMDLQLEAWAVEYPPQCSHLPQTPTSHRNRPSWSRDLLSGHGAPEKMHTFANCLAASKWSTCQATRIQLGLTLLELLQRRPSLSSGFSGLKDRIIDLLLALTSEIAYTIPYSLAFSIDGSSEFASKNELPTLRGYMVLWPAYISFLCLRHELVKGMDYRSRGAWFKEILGFLRESIGIAKVQLLVEEIESPSIKQK